MELSTIKHIDPDHLGLEDFDLFLTCLSHESRSVNIARMIEANSVEKLVLVPRQPLREHAFKENDKYLKNKRFQFEEVTGNTPDFDKIFANFEGDNLNLMIDGSCMPPEWFRGILQWFAENPRDFKRVRIRIAITLAAFGSEGASLKLKNLNHLSDNGNRTINKKQALLLGLGHEEGVSSAIIKKIKPDLVYLFYADPPVDKRFVEKLFVNNHSVIHSTPIRNLVAYPVHNCYEIYQILINIIMPLRNEYTISLVPRGPKVFSVASLLVNAGYPDTVISTPEFRKNPMIDKFPAGDPAVVDVFFEEDE
jgi:hypothetical protein